MVHKTTITPNPKVWFFAERTLIYSLIAVFLFITLSPLVWVLSTSLKPNTEAISFPPNILPKEPTADNYIFVPNQSHFST